MKSFRKERTGSSPSSLTCSTARREGVVRIVGGIWRRTPLAVADLAGLRPTPERVRETVFDWIGHLLGTLEGSSVLDLFAGSGALGLEALSRGAASLDAVERDRRQAAAIEGVVKKLGAAAEVHVSDAFVYLEHGPDRTWDLIFIDPPFALDLQERAVRAALGKLAPDGVLYVERPGGETGEEVLSELGLVRLRAGSAGAVSFELLARRTSPLAALAREPKPAKRRGKQKERKNTKEAEE